MWIQIKVTDPGMFLTFQNPDTELCLIKLKGTVQLLINKVYLCNYKIYRFHNEGKMFVICSDVLVYISE